jgi:hypothetical protein
VELDWIDEVHGVPALSEPACIGAGSATDVGNCCRSGREIFRKELLHPRELHASEALEQAARLLPLVVERDDFGRQRGHDFSLQSLYIGVTDLDTAIANVKATGGTIETPKLPTPSGEQFVLFRDPAGNRMGLVGLKK